MSDTEAGPRKKTRLDGVAPIKAEFVLPKSEEPADAEVNLTEYDDAAEVGGLAERGADGKNMNQKKRKKERGQNKARKFQQVKDEVQLCTRFVNGEECPFKENCRFEHDIQVYLKSKLQDIPGVCPVFEAIGYCPAGVKCRWLGSHFKDNVVLVNEDLKKSASESNYEVHRITPETRKKLQKRQYDLEKSEKYVAYLNSIKKNPNEQKDVTRSADANANADAEKANSDKADSAAAYIDAPFKPLEKKKLYYERAKILSPLTTVGNLPFRRLMKTLGADVTYSEMALSVPLVQGAKSEWALMRAHSSELPGFGAQIAGNKYECTTKAAQLIAELAPQTSEINMNCGCPIDLLYRSGAGSALMDNPGKLLKMARGMSAVSQDIPVSIKIRTGIRDGHPTAKTLATRAVKEGVVSAITIHGRSRTQRYTKQADWEYIEQVASIVKKERQDNEDNDKIKPWIIGNGDVYSWEDWYEAVDKYKVDSVMVARGALIKPWIFEEIEAKQYLDKSSTERLAMVEQYCKFGLEHWGSDQFGINLTRRFACEFLSFFNRYVPVGILEYLPPKLNDRPPLWKGRDELETLFASKNYKDWIKVTEMFLGPAGEEFDFIPKHKSNAY